MQWLEAAAAFAVVMMVFSTLATVVLETAHRILRLREYGLKQLMQAMHREVICPYLSARLNLKQDAGFVDTMTKIHAVTNESDSPFHKKWINTAVGRMTNRQALTNLSTLGFVERLVRTREGEALLQLGRERGEDYLKATLAELGSRYEAFGDNLTQYFQRRARLSSCLIGLLVAFSLNIDAVNLFGTLLADPSVRSGLIDRGAQAGEEMELALAALERARTAGDDAENFRRIRENIEELRSVSGDLLVTGIPIGWDSAPWHTDSWSEAGSQWTKVLWSLRWFFFVTLTGLLIGLGGPFWFDTFKKLSMLVAIVRGAQTSVQKAVEANQTQRDPLGASSDGFEERAAEIFTRASRIAVTIGDRGRPTLAADGSLGSEGLR